MFREATSDDIEKAILDYINVNKLYPIGSYVTNTNIGGNYTDIKITRPIYAMKEINDKIIFYVDNFKVYDSAFGFADFSDKPTAKPTPRVKNVLPKTDPTTVREGTKEVGGDGNTYVARKSTRGINQWKKVK
jgi:hypothetical protein